MSNVSFVFTCLVSDEWKKLHQGVLEKFKVKQRRTSDLKGPWGCACGALLLHNHRCLNCQNVFHLPARKSRAEWSISFHCDYLIDLNGLPAWFSAISLNPEAMLAIAPCRLVNCQITGVALASAPFSFSKLWEDLLRRCFSGWPTAFQKKVCAFRCTTYWVGFTIWHVSLPGPILTIQQLDIGWIETYTQWVKSLDKPYELKVFSFILMTIDIQVSQ